MEMVTKSILKPPDVLDMTQVTGDHIDQKHGVTVDELWAPKTWCYLIPIAFKREVGVPQVSYSPPQSHL